MSQELGTLAKPWWVEAPQAHKGCTKNQQMTRSSPHLLVESRFEEQMKEAGRWQEYQLCLLREGSFSTRPCLLLSCAQRGASSSPALRELGWAAKKNRGNHYFMSIPFLPFMLLGISPCVSPSPFPFHYVASKPKESIPVWLLQRWEMERSLCSSSPVSCFRVPRTSTHGLKKKNHLR